MMRRIGERAVVIGASMAGLLAARALADFYDTVTVLERDTFPLSDLPRKGVPQGRHAHGLLARGRSVIEQFFPGWTDEVVASGGVRGDIAVVWPKADAPILIAAYTQGGAPKPPQIETAFGAIGRMVAERLG